MEGLMQMRVLVLGKSRYDFTSSDTGEVLRGCKVRYIQSFQPTEKNNSCGVDIMQSTMPYDAYLAIGDVPAWYLASMKMSVDSKGKPVLQPELFEYVEPFKLGK